jgi:dethiobiotin synthetase
LRGLFVAGTDTEAGKTVVAGAICAALAAGGEHVAAFKPVVTGTDEETGDWPRDHELLAAQTGQRPEEVAPLTFGPAVSPHYAAELAGSRIEPLELARAARALGEGVDALVCEGVGGLMVPLTPGYLVRDFAVDLGLPVVIAARPGLGTINHTLLTVEAARAVGLSIAGVVLTPWRERPEAIEVSNRDTIEQLGQVAVAGLPPTGPDRLAEAGAALPLSDWLTAGQSPSPAA